MKNNFDHTQVYIKQLLLNYVVNFNLSPKSLEKAIYKKSHLKSLINPETFPRDTKKFLNTGTIITKVNFGYRGQSRREISTTLQAAPEPRASV